MENVLFFIIPKQLWIRMALEFGIKVGEEVGMAEQYPIKEENIVNFHEVKHNEEPYEKSQKVNWFWWPSQALRTIAPRNNKMAARAISQPMMWAPRNRSFLSGMMVRYSLGAEEKKRLSWIKATPAYRIRKYAAIIIRVAMMVIFIAALAS